MNLLKCQFLHFQIRALAIADNEFMPEVHKIHEFILNFNRQYVHRLRAAKKNRFAISIFIYRGEFVVFFPKMFHFSVIYVRLFVSFIMVIAIRFSADSAALADAPADFVAPYILTPDNDRRIFVLMVCARIRLCFRFRFCSDFFAVGLFIKLIFPRALLPDIVIQPFID